MIKVDYLCLRAEGSLDGRGIYDKRFCSALSDSGVDVNVVEIDLRFRRAIYFPLWARGVVPNWREKLRKAAKLIVSHELLIPVVLEARPDLFIIHNFAPAFDWPSEFGYTTYYKFQARSFFHRAILAARKTMVLSAREQVEVFKSFGVEVSCEPPGVRVSEFDNPHQCNYSMVRRSGTLGWYPKRRSAMSENEIRAWLGDDITLVDVAGSERCFSLIEDKFLAGFKLKLLESLYRGDFIVSRVDLRDELDALGLCHAGFSYCCDQVAPSSSLRSRFASELTSEFVAKRRRYLQENYAWSAIVERVLSGLL